MPSASTASPPMSPANCTSLASCPLYCWGVRIGRPACAPPAYAVMLPLAGSMRLMRGNVLLSAT